MRLLLLPLILLGQPSIPTEPLTVDAAYLHSLGQVESITKWHDGYAGLLQHPTRSFRSLEGRSGPDRADWTLRALKALAFALELYTIDCDGYPPGFSIRDITGAIRGLLPEPSLHDGWGYTIRYDVTVDREHYRISSPGIDGVFSDPPHLILATSQDTCLDPVVTATLRADIVIEDGCFLQVPNLIYP